MNPIEGEIYWFIDSTNEVKHTNYSSLEKDDVQRSESWNYFASKQEAEKALKEILYENTETNNG